MYNNKESESMPTINESYFELLKVFKPIYAEIIGKLDTDYVEDDGSYNWDFVSADMHLAMQVEGLDLKHSNALQQEIDYCLEKDFPLCNI